MSSSPSARLLSPVITVVAMWFLGTGCGIWPMPPRELDDCEAVERYLSSWGLHLVVSLPDPASVYCNQVGGDLQSGEGGSLMCILPDGTEREEWDLYCSDCGASPYCGWSPDD